MADDLGDREREVLRAVVQEYISTGEPVGSSHLAKRPEFDVSSATLRNVLADLEELGYLEKPHTSAGRVPTDRGYRFYVDTLLQLRDPPSRDRELIQQGILSEASIDGALHEAGRVLHSMTHHAGLVLTPRPSATVFHRIEFVSLRENRILAILVAHNGQVQNKAFTVDFPVTPEELVRSSNYLSELLRELPIEDVRPRILSEIQREKAQYDALSSKALKLAASATDLPTGERVLIEGTNSFLETPEFADVERMRALFRALEQKHHLLELLDRVQRTQALQIFIGSESTFAVAGDVSVVATPYRSGDKVLGALGVIGPTRMNYQRVIPLVDFTAQVVSRLLEKI